METRGGSTFVLTIHNRSLLLLLCCEGKVFEHIKTCDSNAFAALVLSLCPGLNVPPMITCTCIKENRDEEQINQSTGNLQGIGLVQPPLFDEVINARHVANLEMLPSTVRRDCVKLVRTKVTLLILISAPDVPSDLVTNLDD
jgi:hypothetical protein